MTLRCLLPLLLFGLVHSEQLPAGLSDYCYQRSVLSNIYGSLHDAIKENVIGCDDGGKHVELLSSGKPLMYDKFNPGKRKQPLTLSQFGTLPMSVVENALPFVDKIFPTGTSAQKKVEDDYNFESLSSTFSYILRHMMVRPKNFTNDEVLKAKYYLQELVPNSERVLIKDTHNLPRLLLYDYYRTLYLEESGKRDSQIDKNRLKLSQQMFEEWGQKELPPLMSDVDAAYMKWQVLGYKTEVENQLQYFDVDRQEDKLMSTRALFLSAGRPSERDPHVTIYPFTFIPHDWYQTLKSNVQESADELRYRKSLIQAEQALLNASREELNNITSEDIKYTLEQINKSVAELDITIQNAVDKLLQFEIECFTRVNASACEVIVNGHTAFNRILDKIAEHFEQASYLQSLLKSREESITIMDQKLQSTATQINILDTKIKAAMMLEIEKDIDLSSNNNIETRTCPDKGKIHFTFDTKDMILDASVCGDIENSQHKQGDGLPYCLDERVPVNITQSSLWSVSSCSVDHQLRAFGLHDNFTHLMNSSPAKVTATLSKVDIHRPWFDENIFKDFQHFTMKKGRGVVSPGPIEPGRYYHEVVTNGQYLMPQFTSSFILASDVKVYFPSLGIWNDSDTDNQTNNAVNILMKYTYAPNLAGGYGPFSFAPAGGPLNNVHNFRVERSRGGILISIPGAQIIGHITTVIPKFPSNQTLPTNSTPCQESPSSTNHGKESPSEGNRRRRRSVDEHKEDIAHHLDILQLAKSLFSEKLSESDSFLHRNGFLTPIQSVHKLMDQVASSNERVVEFMDTLNSAGKGDPASAYQNKTSRINQQFITPR